MSLLLENFVDASRFAHADALRGSEPPWTSLGGALVAYLTAEVRDDVRGTVLPGAHLGSRVQIGEGSIVEPGAFIEGPTIIGRNCRIRHTAYIRGNVLIRDDCVVGHATEVKGSILLDGAKAAHFAYVGDSILGNRTNLGAGTKLANFKFTGTEIKVPYAGSFVDTGVRKFGAVVGDDVQIGCNAVTSPGCVLGKATFVFPCVCVQPGVYDARARISR